MLYPFQLSTSDFTLTLITINLSSSLESFAISIIDKISRNIYKTKDCISLFPNTSIFLIWQIIGWDQVNYNLSQSLWNFSEALSCLSMTGGGWQTRGLVDIEYLFTETHFSCVCILVLLTQEVTRTRFSDVMLSL